MAGYGVSAYADFPYGGGATSGGASFQTVYLEAPFGWQPWDIVRVYQVSFWDVETIGGVSAMVANCISSSQWQKVWLPLASVEASG